jgi:hypothetical protein
LTSSSGIRTLLWQQACSDLLIRAAGDGRVQRFLTRKQPSSEQKCETENGNKHCKTNGARDVEEYRSKVMDVLGFESDCVSFWHDRHKSWLLLLVPVVLRLKFLHDGQRRIEFCHEYVRVMNL